MAADQVDRGYAVPFDDMLKSIHEAYAAQNREVVHQLAYERAVGQQKDAEIAMLREQLASQQAPGQNEPSRGMPTT